MRTTINLDDDVHELASFYAAARDITLGAGINELARRSLTSPQPLQIVIEDNGLAILPSRGRKITLEMVKATQDDDLSSFAAKALRKKRSN